jgi:hypothetical protein
MDGAEQTQWASRPTGLGIAWLEWRPFPQQAAPEDEKQSCSLR